MNTPTLYFLRSSEQFVLNKMLPFAYRLDELNIEEPKELNIYKDFYGFTKKDLGLYATINNEVIGAIWGRKLNIEHNSQAFVDEDTLVLSMAVLPNHRGLGIGSAMMEQFLLEAAATYKQLSVSVLKDSKAIKFYEKFDFEYLKDTKSVVDNLPVCTMVKRLVKKEIKRPNDGYDPQKWMD